MYPERSLQTQIGAGLPIAIFIITVLSLIVLSMSKLQESTGSAISLQIQSQRAFFAAESGAQIAVTELIGGNSCPSSITFNNAGLSGCEARLSGCATGDGIDFNQEYIYRVVSLGVCGEGVPDEARRTVEVVLR